VYHGRKSRLFATGTVLPPTRTSVPFSTDDGAVPLATSAGPLSILRGKIDVAGEGMAAGTGLKSALRPPSKYDVFDAKNAVFGSKRAEIEGSTLLISQRGELLNHSFITSCTKCGAKKAGKT
jgi:hypothetical protein